MICSVVAILLMTSVIAFWIYRKHSRKREATLRETVKVLNADLNHFKDRAEQLLAPEIRTMNLTSRFLNLLSRHFDKDAIMSVFKDEQFRRTFIEIVDILHDGHVTLLERKLDLKPDNVILFAMYISSFSVNTITCILSIKSDLYYNRISRLRSKVVRSEDEEMAPLKQYFKL